MKSTNLELLPMLQSSQLILVTTHAYPDGDAIGAMLGLSRSLKKRGADVDMVLSTDIGERFEFMFHDEAVLRPEQVRDSYDLVIILDIGSEDRTGFPERIRSLHSPLLNIDHHATNEGFGDIDIIDTDSSSTCELVYQLIKASSLPLDKEVAEGLYLGLVTDSRYFQNSNVSRQTFLAAADLISSGADHQLIIKRLTQSRSSADLKILGIGLSRFETKAAGKIAYTYFVQNDFSENNVSYRQAWSSGIFNYLISLESALVSVCFVESDTGVVFCEFRSKDGVDVASVATRFGGGGHRSASGCSQKSKIPDVMSDVLSYLEQYLAG